MKLSKDLRERNEIYTDASNLILAQCKEVLDTVFDGVVESKMSIDWTAIDFHPNNQMLLNVMGIAYFKIGHEMITESGTKIFIDVTNVKNYTRQMRFILPLKAVYDAAAPLVIQWLKEYSILIEKLPQDEIEAAMGDLVFLKENFTVFADHFKDIKMVTVDLHDGFDLNSLDLDSDQIKQLKLLRPEGQA